MGLVFQEILWHILFIPSYRSRRSLAKPASYIAGPIISGGCTGCGFVFGVNAHRLPSSCIKPLFSRFLNCLIKLERKFETISLPLSTCIKGVFDFFFWWSFSISLIRISFQLYTMNLFHNGELCLKVINLFLKNRKKRILWIYLAVAVTITVIIPVVYASTYLDKVICFVTDTEIHA